MDALILSCGTGGGHDMAAYAIKNQLISQGHTAVIMNPYDLRGKGVSHRINQAYISLVRRCPGLFGLIYQLGNLYRKLPFRSPVYHVNRGMAAVLDKFLRNNHFDIIIATHLFPAEILTQMKNQGMQVPKSIFITTDYTCIPFTEETDCDIYVVPTQACGEDSVRRGIPEEKIRVLGIPVRGEFSRPITKEKARKKLGLSRNRKYILLCGGSMGAGSIVRMLRTLLDRSPKNVNFIVICGSNEKLYHRLGKKRTDRVMLLQSTDKIAYYVHACDLYLTKPGGLSTTEAAVAGVPLGHLPPIPGCETLNRRFFTTQGMSVQARPGKKGAEALLKLLNDPAACEAMVARQKAEILPNSAEAICGLAASLAGGEEVPE